MTTSPMSLFKGGTVLILTFMFACLVSFSAYAGIDGLVAYYPFDGNANDISRNGNNGTENGNVNYVADC